MPASGNDIVDPHTALLFIDANIFLDFYRVANASARIELLELIEKEQDRIITGAQVEMEYYKNRQNAILLTLDQYKAQQMPALTPPAFLIGAKPAADIAAAKQVISKETKSIEERLKQIIADPATHDPVFKTLGRFFRNPSPFNLRYRQDTWKVIKEVRETAAKRYSLGYPPRKHDDTSLGDAVNWEWVLRCAKDSGRDVIIVSNDGDYGVIRKEGCYLNDYLHMQFAEFVAEKRAARPPKIMLTNLLSEAFKLIEVQVSDEATKEEKARVEHPAAPLRQFSDVAGTIFPGFSVASLINASGATQTIVSSTYPAMMQSTDAAPEGPGSADAAPFSTTAKSE